MIELKDVTITAGKFELKGISFSVNAGDHAVLMGQTGRGKTTILEAICGLRSVAAGRIVVNNRDITDWLPGDRGIGYVPQDLALFPTLSVAEHLSFALRLRKRPPTEVAGRVNEMANVLGIQHLLSRSVKALSGGESQRVALGRALSFRPSVLLLDEPFSALDETTRADMHSLLKNVTQSYDITTLHVTHSSLEAQTLANRRFVLNDGLISEQEL